MQLRRLVLLLLLNLALVPVCSGAVKSVDVHPLVADVGDVVTVKMVAAPGELVPVVIEFDSYVGVSGGEYSLRFKDIVIPSSTNRMNVRVSDVENLEVAVKFVITYVIRENAVDGSASLTRSNVPAGEYDITVSGETAVGIGTVKLSFTLEVTLTMDENGEYTYRLDTADMPIGTFSFDLGGAHRTVNIEEGFILPPPVVPDPPEPIDPEMLDPEEVAKTMENYTVDALSVLLEMEAGQAALIVDNLSLEKAVEFITGYNASGVLDEISINRTVQVIEVLDNVTSGVMMNELGPDRAGEVLLQVEEDVGASIIRSMVDNNVTDAAVRVEHAVKNRNNEADPEAYLGKTAQLMEIIGRIEPATLAQLFQSIALLPNTPSTVADLLEILDLNTTLRVVAEWLGNGELEVLSTVLGLLSHETIVDVYNGSESGILFPLLSNETIAWLPESPSIHVETTIAPEAVMADESVTVTLYVMNNGADPGHKNITANLDGQIFIDEWVILYPGEARTIRHTLTLERGEHTISSEGSSHVLTVAAPPTPMDIRIKELKLDPEHPTIGEPVSFTISLENLGETGGDLELEVRLDGGPVDSFTMTFDPFEQRETSTILTFEDEGVHEIMVNEQSLRFTVESRPSRIPGAPLLSLALGIVTVLFTWRRERPIVP